MHVIQGCMRITFEQWKTKHIEEGGINNISLNHDPLLSHCKQIIRRPVYTDGRCYFRKIMNHSWTQHFGRRVPAMQFTTEYSPVPRFINTIFFCVELVV